MNTEMLARIGAETRLQAIDVERGELLKFLNKSGKVNGHTNGHTNGVKAMVQDRPKRKWSAAARKAASVRMKANWVARRKAAKK